MDKVAAIRYASVYYGFKTPKDFVDYINNLPS